MSIPAPVEANSETPFSDFDVFAPESGASFSDRARRLKQSGLLDHKSPSETAIAMREIAVRDLSLARLYEGHFNARTLIETYGDQALQTQTGELLGVWGAEAPTPVRETDGALVGQKRFASGLGFVDRAIVTGETPDGQQLYLVSAQDTDRHDPAAWDMAGMQESRSGGFDCAGLEPQRLGQPGDFQREPLFLGGTWRIAAVTLGGIIGLLDRAADGLRASDRLDAEAQLLRLGPVAGRAVALWPAVIEAGAIASGPTGRAAPEDAATRSLALRLETEELAQVAVSAVERSVGLALFAAEHPTGRAARDLACYIRQAARDAFQIRTAKAFLSGPLSNWLDR
ncbi:Acyl-CoA dehydrogenase [Poseidonocella pacifica]|uniref:Acyl-CoA dehydrogenase n=1 Tax=Poseidonocella pacifica TaxID=871651 RepID=A0A1I0YTA9_9RHOB|nr:acyl-CoA dehydrogenase [Poseidonocella pacifica]SFB16217.1 Acyl-CoA dehydrogenase [Poseidonocella pacifica]